MLIENNEELHLLISAAYSEANHGAESHRMIVKFMDEIERIAQVDYDATGNVRFHKLTEAGALEIKDDKPIPVTYLKETQGEIPLNGCREWIRARMEKAKFAPSQSRRIVKLLDKLDQK